MSKDGDCTESTRQASTGTGPNRSTYCSTSVSQNPEKTTNRLTPRSCHLWKSSETAVASVGEEEAGDVDA